MTSEGRPSEPHELLSAEVVMYGPHVTVTGPISGGNLAQHRPDPDRAAQAREWFEQRGFITSDVRGVGFSLSGPRTLFDAVFDAPRPGADVGPHAGETELQLPEMPEQIAGSIDRITFSTPPDFGPTSY